MKCFFEFIGFMLLMFGLSFCGVTFFGLVLLAILNVGFDYSYPAMYAVWGGLILSCFSLLAVLWVALME